MEQETAMETAVSGRPDTDSPETEGVDTHRPMAATSDSEFGDNGTDEAQADAPANEDGQADEESSEAAALAAMAAADPEATAALRAEWGEAFGRNLALAREGVKAIASPDLVAILEDRGLGDHPALIRSAAEIGRRLRLSANEQRPPSRQELERLDAEIDRLHALQFSHPAQYRSERTQRTLSRLYARRYGRGDHVDEGEHHV